MNKQPVPFTKITRVAIPFTKGGAKFKVVNVQSKIEFLPMIVPTPPIHLN